MPTYGLHEKMAEVAFKPMQKYIDLDVKYIMLNAIGPDAFMVTASKLFDRQHVENVGDYFVCLMDEIKSNKLLENPDAMAYLYGAIFHYALDVITHPLIYFMTQANDYGSRIWDLHGVFELWLDDYFHDLYHDEDNKNLFAVKHIKDKTTNQLIDYVYNRVYCVNNAALKYNTGLELLIFFEKTVRQNKAHVAPLFDKLVSHGQIYNNGDKYRAVPYLNLEHDVIYDPVTCEHFTDSFLDLWYKALEYGLELVEMANNYLYKDIPINYDAFNKSYNTGHIWTGDSEIKIYRYQPVNDVKKKK